MSIRMRRAETDRLALSGGDSILVKRYLTAGEYRDMVKSSHKPVTIPLGATLQTVPRVEFDSDASGQAQVLAYLLDWTFQDADGRPIVIADQPAAVVAAALRAIDADAYMEVQNAIQRHADAIDTALKAEKKMAAATAPDKTLSSVG